MSGERAGDLAIASGYTQNERCSSGDARAWVRQPRSRAVVNARIMAIGGRRLRDGRRRNAACMRETVVKSSSDTGLTRPRVLG
jgi:hypothetical protein